MNNAIHCQDLHPPLPLVLEAAASLILEDGPFSPSFAPSPIVVGGVSAVALPTATMSDHLLPTQQACMKGRH